jgi:transposase
MTESQTQFQFRAVSHLPLIRAVLDDIGIYQVIEEELPKHTLSVVSDADCAVAFILNVLSGGPAMYRMNWWLERMDTDILFGEGVPAEAFNDTRLALALDHLDAIGTDNILAKVVDRFLSRPGRETAYSIHHDTTSVSVYGAYEDADAPVPTYGYSKKHRPDLKQLIFGLSLHGSAGIPLAMTVMDGNTPDSKAARDHLSLLAKRLPAEDEVTFVTDCKGFDGTTVGQILGQGFHFVSLVADSFGCGSFRASETVGTMG